MDSVLKIYLINVCTSGIGLHVNINIDFVFQGYNEYRRKKQKSQPLEAQQLQQHAEVLMSLCIRPVMRSSPAWELAHNDIKDLAKCLMSYNNYLLSQNKKVQTNQNLDHPCRPVAEWISVWTVMLLVLVLSQNTNYWTRFLMSQIFINQFFMKILI
jgi:hypothetical protein